MVNQQTRTHLSWVRLRLTPVYTLKTVGLALLDCRPKSVRSHLFFLYQDSPGSDINIHKRLNFPCSQSSRNWLKLSGIF